MAASLVFVLRVLAVGDSERNCPALLERARAGDRTAQNDLINRHRDRVFGVCFSVLHNREEAEDAAQEAFVRAFAKLALFRGESEFGTWLYRLALNLSLEKVRGRSRRQTLAPTTLFSAAENECGVGAILVAPDFEAQLALEATLDALPEALRVVLLLREQHGFSYDEIAAILRVPTGTVKSRLHDARRRFMNAWNTMEQEARDV